MVISQASECAIRAMLYLAQFPPDAIVGKKDICNNQEITPAFLIKIMQPLISKGLVRSYRGKTGGFSLHKAPNKISLLEIIRAVEGPVLLNKCMIHSGYCKRDKLCAVHQIWHKAKNDLERTLNNATLTKLLRPLKSENIFFWNNHD